MESFSFTVAAAGALTGAALWMASTATAAPTGPGSAADTVNALRAQGYSVQINGARTEPLSDCMTTGVQGLPDTSDQTTHGTDRQWTTVYVDVSCPDNA